MCGYLSRVVVCDWNSFLCSVHQHSPDTGDLSILGHKHILHLPDVCPHPHIDQDHRTHPQDLTDTLHSKHVFNLMPTAEL